MNADNSNPASVGRPMSKINKSISSNITTKVIRISAHHLKWSWTYQGTTTRHPVKVARLKGWERRFYEWRGATIALNYSPKKQSNIMELWTKSRPYKRTEKMIYANWSKADLIAREFSAAARIPIQPIQSPHPADLQAAHLVIENKPMGAILKPYAGTAPRVGLLFDKSHKGRAELTGRQSAEGAMGLDYWLIDFPQRVSLLMDSFDDYNKNIRLHLKAIQELRDAVKEMRK